MSQLFDEWGRPFGLCKNRACIAKVKRGILYCCAGCTYADEKVFDPDGYHSEGCVKRQKERGVAVNRDTSQNGKVDRGLMEYDK